MPVAFALAQQVVELRDGRRLQVTRVIRQNDRVVLQTTDGGIFSVSEDQVVSPPLENIPWLLQLTDGRQFVVRRLVRGNGQVVFETVDGQSFTISEGSVVSPSLDRIPLADRVPPPPPPPETPIPPPPPEPPTPLAPPELPTSPPPEPEGEVIFTPMPDRWDIAFPDSPRIVKGRLVDPYNQNVLKADKPIIGDEIFLLFETRFEAPMETRRIPVPSGVSTDRPQSSEFFGDGDQFFATPRVFVTFELFKGETAFRPKTWALRITPAFNLNYLRTGENNFVDINPQLGRNRRRQDVSLEEAFGEVKVADLSPNFDFLSARVGIQPFVSDFRAFIFKDSNLGARLFGNFVRNRLQYNVAYFDLLEKETRSELNTFEKREQQVFVANLFVQDFLTPGYQISPSFHYSRDEPTVHTDLNSFPVRPARIGEPRPHEVTASYLGISGDGHIGRLNVTHAYYYVFGADDHNPIAARATDVSAQMAAVEASVDRDWLRFKGSFFFATGDDDPEDDTASGFDSIYDFTNFAGGAFSFWNRSAIPLTQTGVLLKPQFSLLPDLRSNKFEGQANYVNPGVVLLHAGIEADLTPKLRIVGNASYLRFETAESLRFVLFQETIDESIGFDLAAGLLYRPLLNENVFIAGGITGLLPGAGFEELFSSSCSIPGCGAPSQTLYNVFVDVRLIF